MDTPRGELYGLRLVRQKLPCGEYLDAKRKTTFWLWVPHVHEMCVWVPASGAAPQSVPLFYDSKGVRLEGPFGKSRAVFCSRSGKKAGERRMERRTEISAGRIGNAEYIPQAAAHKPPLRWRCHKSENVSEWHYKRKTLWQCCRQCSMPV